MKIDYWDYLCFFWYLENNLDLFLKEYRMMVYVFGNCLFLVVVIYGICCCVVYLDFDVIDFVFNNFYVDDGFFSCFSEEVVVDLMKRI